MATKAKSKPAKKAPEAAPEVRTPVPATPRPADAPPLMPPEVLGEVPLSQIRPCPFNVRKAFDDADIAALAESIRELGLKDRLLVRPIGAGGKPARFAGGKWEDLVYFQLADGERRYRALKTIVGPDAKVPVVVRPLSDGEVLAVMLVSREQSRDLRPSELVAGYLKYADGRTVAEVAAKVGESVGHVRSVLALAKLPAWALAAVDAGTLPRRTAELVARIPGERSREECAAMVLCDDVPPADCKDVGKWVEKNRCEPCLPYRETEDLVRREFQVELKQAKFSRKALDLVDGAGSCDACPKRAGNNEEAKEAGTRADVCLDPACFRAKTDEHNRRAVKLAKESGRTVLAAKEADKLFNSWDKEEIKYGSGYVDLDKKCHESGANGRTYRQLLKSLPADKVVIAVGPDGNPHELVKEDVARKVLKEEHKIGAKQSSGGGDDSWKREQKKRAEKAALYKAAAQKAAGMAEARVREAWEDGVGLVTLLQRLAFGVATHASADACRMVSKRRGLEKAETEKGRYADVRAPVEDLALKLDGSPELIGLIAEIVAAHEAERWCSSYYSGRMDKEEAAWWKAFGVDRDKLLAEAKAEKEAGKKPAKGKKPDTPECAAAGKCRVCGCTEADCTLCVERTGEPCTWTSEKQDLCSACLPLLETDFGSLFVGRNAIPDRGRVQKLQDAGVRAVGHVEALDRVNPPKGLRQADVDDLKKRAKGWLKEQLAETREMLKAMPPAGEPAYKCEAGKKSLGKGGLGKSKVKPAVAITDVPLAGGGAATVVSHPDAAPRVTKPAGDLPLIRIDGFPASVAHALEKRGDAVKTLSDLERHVTRNSTTILANLPTHQVVYETITRLVGMDGFLATTARDAVMKHTQPGWKSPEETQPQTQKEKP